MEKLPFEMCFNDVTGGNVKIKQMDYLSEGEIPIIDQGKALIGGFTNDKTAIVKCKLPCVIYGDHSRNIKYFDKPFAIGADGAKLLEATDRIVSKYGYYYLQTVKLPDAGYDRSYKYLKRIQIPVPDLETQNKIVAILDKAKTVLDKREKSIRIYDELLRATFLDMFGDPVLNPKGWKTKSLLESGKFKNGLNYKSEELGHDFLILGVGDFKSNWEIKNVNNLPKISLKEIPSDDFFLNDNDLVFVRSNGNKQLVGRCVLVKPGQEKVTFSGFCIRYRLHDNTISPIYLAHLFRVPTFKDSMLQNGRGANILNINQEFLGKLKIPLPSKKLQLEFENKISALQAVLNKIQLFSNQSDFLLKSLSQQVFSERITIDIDAELEALINAIDVDKKDEENKIETVKKDLTFLQRLIDKLQEQDFENSDQYEKAKYITFRIMKEESNLIKQQFKDAEKKIILQLQ